MGAMKQAKQDLRSRVRSRKQTATPADYGNVASTCVLRAIVAVTGAGGAIRFGYTRDGGAYAIGLYLGGETETEYLRPEEDMCAWLEALADSFKDDPKPG